MSKSVFFHSMGYTARAKLLNVGLALCIAAVIVFTASFMAFAQSSNLEVRGNNRITTGTILSVVAEDLATGNSAANINAAVQSLNETGFFKSVDVIREGGGLVIIVDENPTINRVAVEGNKRLKDEVLLSVIGSQSRQTYSPRQAERDASNIAEAYSQAGRLAASVSPRIIERSSNRVDLVFEVVEGNVSEIQKISFVGNREVSDRRLRAVLESKQAGLFKAIVQRDTFIEDRIEFDKQKLREFYLRNGYIDFRVLSASSELTREKDGFLVTFKLQEGQQYRFGEASVVSSEPNIDPADYEDILKALVPGRVYRPSKVETVAEEMDARAAGFNRNFISTQPRIVRNDETRTLDVEFDLTRGQRLFIERIDIEGNSTTQDKVIRREFRLAEGDAFNRREIQLAADRIRGLGFFSNVAVEAREGSTPGRVIIDVNVEEAPTGSLSFGLGYSSATGASGTVGLEERNFLGRGQRLAASFSTSSEDRNFNLSFDEPSFLDRDLSVGFDLGYRTTSSSFLPVDNESLTFSPRVSFPVNEFGRLTAFYRYREDELKRQETTVDDVTTFDAASQLTLDEVALGKLSESVIGLSYVHDRRNSVVEPTAGYRFQISQEFAGLGGDKEYSKTSVEYKTFRSFYDEQLIVSLEVEGGYIKNFGDGSTINERFFLGGDQLRGFENFGVGPRDTAATAGNDPVGGNTFAVARLEASFPIGLPEEYGIFGGVFFDVGSVWGLDNVPAGTEFNGEDSSASIRSAVGVSIFWDTAIGPLRFNFAKPLEKEDYDRTESFRFTIDTRF